MITAALQAEQRGADILGMTDAFANKFNHLNQIAAIGVNLPFPGVLVVKLKPDALLVR